MILTGQPKRAPPSSATVRPLTCPTAEPRVAIISVSRAIISWMRSAILADNVATNAGDMVLDVSCLSAGAAVFDAESVIDAVGTLGDRMRDMAGIAVHSDTYRLMLKQDMIDYLPDWRGPAIAGTAGWRWNARRSGWRSCGTAWRPPKVRAGRTPGSPARCGPASHECRHNRDRARLAGWRGVRTGLAGCACRPFC